MTEPGSRSDAYLTALGRVTTRHGGTVLAAAGVIAAVSILSVTRLRPVASVESMLGENEPSARALKNIAEHFSGMEELIVLASLPDGRSGNEEDARNRLLAFAQRLTDEITASDPLSAMCREVLYRPPPDMRRFVESVVVPHALLYLDEEAQVKLTRRLEPDAMHEQLRRTEEMLAAPGAGGALVKQMLKDPLGLRDILWSALPSFGGAGDSFGSNDGFFSGDGRHLMLRVRGIKPVSDLEFAVAFSEGVREAAERVNEDGLELAYAGAYAIAAESQRSIRGDMIRSIVLSIIFLQVLYGIAYRNIWMLPAALAPVALGILVGFAIFAALGMNLSPITAVVGAILAGLGIDYTIHCLSHYRSDRAEGLPHEEAVQRTLRDIAPALTAACITTVVGFLAISQSSVQALREFGLLGAMGLIASLLAAIFVLPSILTVTLARRHKNPFATTTATPVSARVLRHATKHRRAFLTLAAIAAAVEVGYWVAPRNPGSLFEDDLQVMHPRPNAPLETQHRLAELFQASPDTLLVHLEAQSPETLTAKAHEVRRRLERLATRDVNIVGSYGLASLLPDPVRSDRRRTDISAMDAEQVVARFDAALADSGLNPAAFDAYRDFLRTLLQPGASPHVADVLRYPSLAESVLPLVAPSGASTVHQAITAVITAKPLADRTTRDTTIAEIRSAIADVPGAILTGLTVVGHDTEHTIRGDLRRLMSFAAGIVILWLLIYFRSVGAAILALVPVAFGFVVMLTCMRLFGLKLNTMNLIALPLLVGVGVDDGIFLVTIAQAVRGRRDRKVHQDAPYEEGISGGAGDGHDALVTRLSAGCHAIVMTSLTTILTFGTLAFTSTPAIQSLGIVMALGVSAALVGAIWILAPLLARS